MYRLIALIILFSTGSFAIGQVAPGNYCGTQGLSPVQELFLQNFQANLHPGTVLNTRAGNFNIPVKIHIVGDDNGNGYYASHDVMRVMCELNDYYASVGFEFYIYNHFNYINKTNYYIHDYAAGQLMMKTYNTPNVLNIYFVQDPAGNCGYFSPFRDAVAIRKECAQPEETTVTHEVGHYFSLPHTFDGWEGNPPPLNNREKVDGSNCNSAGDGFCDTSPDYYSDRWQCPSPNSLLSDPNGDTVKPDGTFYMSYANDECTNRFSNQQIGAMQSFLLSARSNLLQHPAPSDGAIDAINIIGPLNNAPGIPSNYAEFSWNQVNGATRYHLQISKIPSMILATVDLLITDTLFVANNLVAGTRYFWRVLPFNDLNTCEEYSVLRSFVAVEPTGINDPLEFKGISIYPNPAASTQTIYIDLNTVHDFDGQIHVFNLNGELVHQTDAIGGELTQINKELTAGIYMVAIISDKIQITRKLVIY